MVEEMMMLLKMLRRIVGNAYWRKLSRKKFELFLNVILCSEELVALHKPSFKLVLVDLSMKRNC